MTFSMIERPLTREASANRLASGDQSQPKSRPSEIGPLLVIGVAVRTSVAGLQVAGTVTVQMSNERIFDCAVQRMRGCRRHRSAGGASGGSAAHAPGVAPGRCAAEESW